MARSERLTSYLLLFSCRVNLAWMYLGFLYPDPYSNLVSSNLRSFLLRCGTRPNEWGSQWDSNSLCRFASLVCKPLYHYRYPTQTHVFNYGQMFCTLVFPLRFQVYFCLGDLLEVLLNLLCFCYLFIKYLCHVFFLSIQLQFFVSFASDCWIVFVKSPTTFW